MVTNRHALIIATYQFEDPDLKQLLAPAQDAEALGRLLRNPAIGCFEVKTLLNEPSHKVKQAIESFFADRKRDDLLLLYYSGHGVKDEDGELYFATHDTRRKILESTSVRANFVNRMMGRSRSCKQVLLLDCCYSGAFARGMVAKAGGDIGTKERFEGHGRVVLTASDAMQYAFEGDAIKGQGVRSFFTQAVVEGIETGEADLDRDGLIALDELHKYVHRRVTRESPNQSPRKWVFDVEGKIFIAWNPHPVNRAVDLTSDVADGRKLGIEQDTGLATQPPTRPVICAGTRDVLKGIAGLKFRSRVNAAVWAPVGSVFAVASSSVIAIYLCDLLVQEQIASIEAGAWIRSVAFSPDGRSLATGLSDNSVTIWDWREGKLITTLHGHTGAVNSVAYSSDGDHLVSGSRDNTLRLWQINSGQALLEMREHEWDVYRVAIAPGDQVLASGGGDDTVRFWRLTDGELTRTLKQPGSTYALDFSPGGELLGAGTGENDIALWQAGSDQRVGTLKGHTGLVKDLAFSPDGGTLASGGNDNTVRLWHMDNGECF